MRHVFVETNWVVACAAPAHHKIPAALDLLERAAREQLILHLPAISIAEARRPITADFQSRLEAERIRQYLLWARDEKLVSPADEELVRVVLDRMEGRVKADLAKIEDTLRDLSGAKGVEVFPLTEAMLNRCAELSYLKLDLKPFDQAILAAILVRAEDLAKEGVTETEFCELDSDLQPWDKKSNAKPLLTELYDVRRIWVYSDFLLQSPQKYEGWPPKRTGE
jgi:hypothetical protein